MSLVGGGGVAVGQYFIFGALCPSMSGLMNKHIVKHIGGRIQQKGYPPPPKAGRVLSLVIMRLPAWYPTC